MNFYSQELNAELGAGEKLIWAGRPKQGLAFGPHDVFLIPFSLLWGGFAFFWEYSVWSGGGPDFFLLFGGAFVLVGIYIIAGRYLHDAWRRKRIIYGVTDKRALILTPGGVKSIRLTESRELNVKRHGNGRMTILFGPNASLFNFSTTGMQGNPWSGAPMVPSFEKIEDGERVYAEIKRIVGL